MPKQESLQALATVCDYLSLVRARTELHEMATNVGLGISKLLERNASKLQIQAAPALFVPDSLIRAPPYFLTLFNEVATVGDFMTRVFPPPEFHL